MNVKFREKSITRERLGWWLRICLTRIFGRRIRIEGREEPLKVLPWIHQGKLLLMGMEADSFSISFSNQYTTLVKTAPVVSADKTGTTHSGHGICHVMLGHQPREVIELLHRRNTELGPTYQHLLAYGGNESEFEHINVEHKIFIDDPSLRGPSNRMSHRELLEKSWEWYCSKYSTPAFLVFTESDLLPLHSNYLDACVRLMVEHNADFGGKLIRDISNTNNPFLLDGIAAGVLQNAPASTPCLHTLGCFMVIHSRIMPAMLQECRKLDGLYFELMFPTAAAAVSGRLLSFDKVTELLKHVVFRPEYEIQDIEKIRNAGYSLIHPVKP